KSDDTKAAGSSAVRNRLNPAAASAVFPDLRHMGAASLAAVYCQVFKAKVGAKMPKCGKMLPT
ncbi:hypothetical protein, partial [Candidatus Avelusimicrobium alvi]|uniref:hypothetical protein n=1 Tax=Candidatus Avelusimicrobium alvi TaxID=3416221 RepID=UPI003D0E4482